MGGRKRCCRRGSRSFLPGGRSTRWTRSSAPSSSANTVCCLRLSSISAALVAPPADAATVVNAANLMVKPPAQRDWTKSYSTHVLVRDDGFPARRKDRREDWRRASRRSGYRPSAFIDSYLRDGTSGGPQRCTPPATICPPRCPPSTTASSPPPVECHDLRPQHHRQRHTHAQ